jgi:hypothetical protein
MILISLYIVSLVLYFKIKYKANGTIQKYKACFITKSFIQVHGVDFGETFSPMVKLTIICVILALATQYDLEVHQLDVKMTFLNCYIDEEIYMEILKGLHTSNNSNMVCKLLKPLYGLKQSLQAWYHRLDSYLPSKSFKRIEADSNLFKHQHHGGFQILVVYVNDYVLINNSLAWITDFKTILIVEFDMTDEGYIHYCLGNQIIRN